MKMREAGHNLSQSWQEDVYQEEELPYSLIDKLQDCQVCRFRYCTGDIWFSDGET